MIKTKWRELRCLYWLGWEDLQGSERITRLAKIARTRFLHERGRHKSYGRADTAVLHGITTRIQWNTSQTPGTPKIE